MDLFSTSMSCPPSPSSSVERLRVEHSRLRRRIIYGMHEPDVQARIYAQVGGTRAAAWNAVDMSSNAGLYTCTQLAALYREIPEVAPPDGGEEVASAVLEAGWWQLAQRVQRDTIALNDCFVRVSVGEEGPAFQIVPPDMVEIVASPLAPAQPLAIKEWIPDPDDNTKWVRLVCDPRVKLYRAITQDGVDVTERVLGQPSFSGEDYPFLLDGRPVLNYVAYHSAASGYALDPYSGREVWDGTLQLGVYHSYYGHCLRNAAHGQRYTIGAVPQAAAVNADGTAREVVADPASLLILEASEGFTGTPTVGQFSPSVDVDRMLASIERRERAIVEAALGNVGVSRRDSDVRSAMSLAVSREAQREAQRAYEPVFRRSDLRLLKLVSGLMGGPTDNWRIQYKSIPRDYLELDAELKRSQGLIASGMLDVVTAYQDLHPGLTRKEAEDALRQISATNREFGGAGITLSPVSPNF